MSNECARYFFTFVTVSFIIFLSDTINCSEVTRFGIKSPIWNIIDKHGEPVLGKFGEKVTEFSAGNVKCERYCIHTDSSTVKDSHDLHLSWDLLHEQKEGSAAPSITDRALEWKKSHLDAEPRSLEGDRNKCVFSIITRCDAPSDCGNSCFKTMEDIMKNLQTDNRNLGSADQDPLSIVKSGYSGVGKSSFRILPNQAEMSISMLGSLSKMELKMPVQGNTMKEISPQLMLTSTSASDGRPRLLLKVLKPLPGVWKLELQGVGNENYQVVVTSAAAPKVSKKEKGGLSSANEGSEDDAQNSPSFNRINVDGNINLTDMVDSSKKSNELARRIARDIQYQDSEESQEIPLQSTISQVETYNDNITLRMDADSIQERIFDRQASVVDLSRLNTDDLPIRKYLTVDVNPNTDLIASPGEYHDVIFDVTNDRVIPVTHYFEVQSSFPVVGRSLLRLVIHPGQTVSLPIRIGIPQVTNPVINRVTLTVRGIDTIEKSANIYVKTPGNWVNDDVKPTIDYYFNNNCPSRLYGERCLKNYWSVDIVVQDTGLGLKSVTTSPRGIYPRSQYVSGTSSPVHFYYASNCCNRVVRVTAVDAFGNTHTRDIDVGEWTNLDLSEIAVIILSIFLIAALIALLVISIIYCYKRRKSQDLPFSQRYGSRSTPRTET